VADNNEPQRVVIVDFDMKFDSMIGFMIKWTLAAIPALLIIACIIFAGALVFGLSFKVLSDIIHK
jgi:hypothetical protein